MMVARSLTHAPKSWEIKTGSIEAGLPIWDAKLLDNYVARYGAVNGAVVLHAGTNCLTIDLPAADKSNLEATRKQPSLVRGTSRRRPRDLLQAV